MRSPVLALAVALLLLTPGSFLLAPGRAGARSSPDLVITGVPRGGPPGVPRGSDAHPSQLVEEVPGLNSSNPLCACEQANLSIAVGPNGTVEVAGNWIVWYAPNGSIRDQSNVTDFFGCPALAPGPLADATVAYDATIDQYLVLALDPGTDGIVLGFNRNATTEWGGCPFVFALPQNGGNRWAAPTLGVAGDEVGVAVDGYNNSTNEVVGSEVELLDVSLLLHGELPTDVWGPLGLPPNLRAIPAIGAGAVPQFAEEDSSHDVVNYWSEAVPPTSGTLQSFHAGALDDAAPVPAPQNGTPDLLAAPPPGVASGIWVNRLLTLVGTVASSGSDAIELWQANTTTGLVRQDVLLQDAASLFDPAVFADPEGDLSIVADASGLSIHPSVVFTGQPYNEPSQAAPFETLAAGTGAALIDCNATQVCLWGNSTSAAPDPANPLEVWVAGEYAPGNGTNWSTYLADTTFPPLASPIVVSDAESVDVGQEVNFTAFESGGIPPYDYLWHHLPSGCGGGDVAEIACRPSSAGQFNVTIQVVDAGGSNASSAPLPYNVSSTLTLAPLVRNRTNVDTGQSISFSTVANGGLAPYTFNWEYPTNDTCIESGAVLSCTVRGPAIQPIVATVTDPNDGTAGVRTSLVVHGLPRLGGLALQPRSVVAGTNLTVITNLSGGSGGYSYSWASLPAGCAPGNTGNFTCVPTAPGNYTVIETVNDSAGAFARQIANLTVLPAPSSPGPTPTSPVVGEIILGVLLVVILIGALPILLRRYRAGPPSRAGGADDPSMEGAPLLAEYEPPPFVTLEDEPEALPEGEEAPIDPPLPTEEP
jgi:hypothetical protein